MFEAQKPGFWLLLNLQRLSLANFKLKRISAASHGILAAARPSCTEAEMILTTETITK